MIRRAALVQSGGSELPIDLQLIRGIVGFDQMELSPAGLLFRVRYDSLDPQLAIDLKFPIDLQIKVSGQCGLIARIVFTNVLIFGLLFLMLIWPPGFCRVTRVAAALGSSAGVLAERLSDTRFITFDRVAIWFLLHLSGFICGGKPGEPQRIVDGRPLVQLQGWSPGQRDRR